MKLSGHRLALALFAGVIAAWLIGMAVVMRHAALPADASGTMLAVFELFPIWELHQGATVSDVSPLLGDKVSNSPQFAQLYTLVLVFLII